MMPDAYLVPALDGVAYGLLLFVLGAGLLLCFGVANILNLAHGTLYALGAYVAVAVSDGTWSGMALAALAGCGAAAACGTLLAGLVSPVVAGGHLIQALLTFGVALIGADLIGTVFGTDTPLVRLPAAATGTVVLLGHHIPLYRLALIAVVLAVGLLMYLVMAWTNLGSTVRASTDNQAMLSCMGVDPMLVRSGALATSAGLAGLAGALGAPLLRPSPDLAGQAMMLSLTVVVVGGLKGLGGVLIAALGIGQAQTLGVTVAPNAAPYLIVVALVGALAARGFMAAREGAPMALGWLR